MSERYLHQTVRFKVTPYRTTNGYIESFGIENHFDGMAMTDDDRVIAIELSIPVSLWEIPHVGVEVKSKLSAMLKELIAEEL